MRVAHIRRQFSKLSETFVYDYVRETASRGVDAHVVCEERIHADTRPFEPVHLTRRLGPLHPRRLRLDLADRLGRSTYPERGRRIAIFADVLRELRPDVVHAHFGHEAALAGGYCEASGTPLVMSHHGVDISARLRDPRWRAAYARLWSIAAAVTVVSEFQRERLRGLGVDPSRVHLVRVGKRLSGLVYRPPAGTVRRLVSVGRLCEKKGHDDAIRALARVNGQRSPQPALRLEIIGEGPLLGQLRNLAEEQGVAGCCDFAGAMQYDAVIRRVREADAFILCSKTAADGDEEGVPTVLMEAQALGLPCVSTQHTGIPEVFPAESRFLLAPEGRPEAVATCLERLCGMTEGERIELAGRGRRHVERHFDLEREVDRLVELYSAVAAARAAR